MAGVCQAPKLLLVASLVSMFVISPTVSGLQCYLCHSSNDTTCARNPSFSGDCDDYISNRHMEIIPNLTNSCVTVVYKGSKDALIKTERMCIPATPKMDPCTAAGQLHEVIVNCHWCQEDLCNSLSGSVRPEVAVCSLIWFLGAVLLL